MTCCGARCKPNSEALALWVFHLFFFRLEQLEVAVPKSSTAKRERLKIWRKATIWCWFASRKFNLKRLHLDWSFICFWVSNCLPCWLILRFTTDTSAETTSFVSFAGRGVTCDKLMEKRWLIRKWFHQRIVSNQVGEFSLPNVGCINVLYTATTIPLHLLLGSTRYYVFHPQMISNDYWMLLLGVMICDDMWLYPMICDYMC